MTSISKTVYIDKLSDIVNDYNNRYHRTIKINPVDFKDNTYIYFPKEVHKKDLKLKVSDDIRILKYKNTFAKAYTSNWSEEVFVIKEVKNRIPSTYTISDVNGEKIIGTFYEKELQKPNQEELRKKVISYMLNGKDKTIHLIAGLIKQMWYKNDSIFS